MLWAGRRVGFEVIHSHERTCAICRRAPKDSATISPLMTPRLSCAHCETTGTCRNGHEGRACAICAKKLAGLDVNSTVGLICSVCGGRGVLETHSLKLQNRFVPWFAAALVFALILLLSIAYFHSPVTNGKDNFGVLIGFAGPIIGAITGYYFKNTQSRESSVVVPHKATSQPLRGPSSEPPTAGGAA
jgi:hypothetical protein